MTENLMRRLGAKLGLRDPHFLRDLFATPEHLATSKEHIIDERSHKVTIPLRANRELSQEEQDLVYALRPFCQDISIQFQDAFAELVTEYRKKGGRTSDKIIDYMVSHKLDMPSFELLVGTKRQELLERIRTHEGWPFDQNSVVVLFNLPKPMAQYWWKGGTEYWGHGSVDVQSMAIEWGVFYRQLTSIIWNEVEKWEQDGFRFDRINSVHEHEPLEYYYIWEVARGSRWES